MRQRVDEMRDKEVINVRDGTKLGFLCDIEMDTTTATLTAIVVYGRYKFFGLFGRTDDIVIPWHGVKLIGDDTILVDYELREYKPRKKSLLAGLIEIK